MHGPFADEYWKAAVTEAETMEAINTWEIVDNTEDMNALQSTWLFKLKYFPDGLIKNVKACFCAGDQQMMALTLLKLCSQCSMDNNLLIVHP